VADLSAYDFDADQVVTLAPRTAGSLPADTMFFGGGDRMVFRAPDPSASSGTPIPFYGHDFDTGVTQSLGDAAELVAVPGGVYGAFRPEAGPPALIDATFTSRALPGQSFLAERDVYAGFAPTGDGTHLAYADGLGLFHLVAVDGSADLTLPGETACLPDFCDNQWPDDGTVLPTVGRAAKFTSDGRAFVRTIGAGCSPPGGVFYTLGRYDLGTGQETQLSLPGVGGFVAFSPLGQVLVTQSTPPLGLWSWPTPLVALDEPDPDPYTHPIPNVPHSFTDDGRYLTYAANGFLMVQDISPGTARKLASIGSIGEIAMSQDTGVAVMWVWGVDNGDTLNALMPDGSSLTLNPEYEWFLTEPRGTVIAFTIADSAGEGTSIYHLEQGATPQVVGNGSPLAISARQVIFRDLDGICSYSW
jgi:hypothetical protein